MREKVEEEGVASGMDLLTILKSRELSSSPCP